MEVCLTLIANAGVLVEYNGVKILIDGIHHEEGHSFSKVPKKILEDMIEGQGNFKNIDYIMFSHEHPDHFTPGYTIEYLKNNVVKCVFMPRDGSPRLMELQNYMKGNDFTYELLKLPVGELKHYKLHEDISVTTFNAIHMGKLAYSTDNYCYLLTLGEKSILFTADADYVEVYFEGPLLGIEVDTVFVNPLFFNNINGRKVIERAIKPRRVGIYHIPFVQDEKYMFRKMVKRDIEKHKSDSYDIFAMWDEGQSVII